MFLRERSTCKAERVRASGAVAALIDRHRALQLTRLTALALALLAGACVYLPRGNTEPSTSLTGPPDSLIEKTLGNGSDQALFIEDPLPALHVRLDMIDKARTSLDLQYFIWQNDQTGVLIIQRLLAAADRGVRVRALLDDIQLKGLVDRIGALDDHPNIEIRIFNPFSVRLRYQLGLLRLAEFVIDGNRLNHRMHNKLLLADGQLAILGGRNIGDDYFGYSPVRVFVDSDLLLSGSVVPGLAAGFDRYWNSRWAYPVSALVSLPPTPRSLTRVRARIAQRLDEADALRAASAPEARADLISGLREAPRLEGGSVVVDDPSVAWGDKPNEIARGLARTAESAQRRVLIVSPYVVLSPALLELAKRLTSRGVTIRVLTNSLGSNDVVIAHAAYARFRRRLLDAGVELYEFRHDSTFSDAGLGAYRVLHSKFIIFDDATVFVGSMNLDPRSLYLNTELGVVLESQAFASEMTEVFERMTQPENAWRVTLEESALRWSSGDEVLDRDPVRDEWQRVRAAFLSLLPLSSQI